MQTITTTNPTPIVRRIGYQDEPLNIVLVKVNEDDIRVYLSWTYRTKDAEIKVDIREFYIYLFENVLEEYEHVKYDQDGDPIPYFRVDTWEEWVNNTNLHLKKKHLTNYLTSIFPDYTWTNQINKLI